MKTADDTFRKLKSCTYEEITDLLYADYRSQNAVTFFQFYRIAPIEEASISNISVLQKRNDILESNGWTHKIYMKQAYDRLHR